MSDHDDRPPARPGPDAGPDAPLPLEVRAVDKSFSGVQALADVSFACAPGRVHALVGENGAGKSTLVKVCTGVHRPDAGQVLVDGRPVAFHAPVDAQRAGLSTVYQEVNLVPVLSVAQNLHLGREPRRFGLVDRRRMRRQAAELLGSYGVPVDPARRLGGLGLGMQQMVAVVRAVSVDCRVLVLDEPTSSLEPREADQLLALVRRLAERGLAVVYVSHKMDELFRVCDDVTVLRDGRVVHTGRMADLTRADLVGHMLGRRAEELAELRARAAHQAHQDRPALLHVDGLQRTGQLRGVSFRVAPGEVVGLGGLLGSGRTETLQAVVGALAVDAGSVRVGETPVRRGSTAAAVRAGLALLPEDRKVEGIVPDLSVRENIALAALPRLSKGGLVSEQRVDRVVDTFVERLRIKATSPRQKVRELSGGNQQKVVLARWLCTEPRVLLLDEPTRGIDVGAKAEVQALVAELAEQGLGIVLVSSELDELVGGSSRIVVLHAGAAVAELDGDEVTEERLMAALAHHGEEVA